MTDKMFLKQALRVSTQNWVDGYLRSIRVSGSEKAEAHRGMCCIFISVFFLIPIEKVNSLTPCYKEVHEGTQKLTGYLDREIGFPMNGEDIDYSYLAPKFFDKFYRLALKEIREYKRKKV